MRNQEGSRGFTLVELLITLAIFGVLALLTYPALLSVLEHQKMIGATHEAANIVRLARLTAVKRNTDIKVVARYTDNTLIAFRDVNGNDAFDADTDEQVGATQFPKSVYFWGPPDGTPGGAAAWVFATPTLIFHGGGDASEDGAFRLRGRNPDYFEVRVEPKATGRVVIKKWGGGDLVTDWWQNGEQGHKWTWND